METKICSVKLVRLENILEEEIKRVAPSAVSDLPVGMHFTRSKITPPNVRIGRKPRKANTGMQYDTNPESDSSAKSPRPVIKPKVFKPSRSGPSQARINSRTKNSATPLVRLPAQKSNSTEPQPVIDDESHAPLSQSTKQELEKDDIPLSILRNQPRGTITIKEHILEQKKESRKYKCRLCEASLSSCKALTKHHHDNHGIMYCDCCNKALQNQRSLDKHMYVHREKTHVCRVCGNKFPFESQLNTHKLTHRKANQRCMYPNCGRKFKSKGDLNRHAAEHSAKWLHCPDCDDYKTKDKRNLDSHRLSHSQQAKHECEQCGEKFVYNTQKCRHIKNNLCPKDSK